MGGNESNYERSKVCDLILRKKNNNQQITQHRNNQVKQNSSLGDEGGFC
jgi:hypothetical protein